MDRTKEQRNSSVSRKIYSEILTAILVLMLFLQIVPTGVFAQETAEIVQWNVTISDDLRANFHLNIPASAAAQTQVAITVGSGAAASYDAVKLPESKEGYRIAHVNLAAAQMTEEISVSVITNNHPVLEKTYTVAGYANTVLQNSSMRQYHALVRALLHYGAKAQLYFGQNTHTLADAGIAFDEEITVPADEREIVIEGKADGISFYGASLLFQNKIGARFYFHVSGSIEDYSFLVNQTAYDAVSKDGLYYVQVDGIRPQDYSADIVMTVSGDRSSQTIVYRPMHYITRMYHRETTSNELKMLLKAMYGYHLAACQDFAQTYDLPEYWITYLDQKIQQINNKLSLTDSKTDAFIFLTDQHLDGTKDLSAAIINYISRHTGIHKVIFGGDLLQGGKNDVELLREYRSSFEDDLLVMPMRGNHDATGNLTESSYFDIMLSPLRGTSGFQDKLYYCYDNTDAKIRYIITDSVASGNNALTSKEQIAWMQSKILELDSNWTVMVFHHGIWEGSASSKVLSYSVDGKLMVDAIDEIYDTAQCTVAGLYSGHTHRDYLGYSEKGYALVSTTVNASAANLSKYDLENPTRTPGTTLEETLDVVFLSPATNTIASVRIGAGSDRSYSYASNLPAAVSGVSLNRTEATTWRAGRTIALRATLQPAKVTNDAVVWRIKSGAEIGTITPNGLECVFTPGSVAGTAVIEVKTVEGDFVSECTITVAESEVSVDLTPEFTWTPGSITYANGVASSQYEKDWFYSNRVDVGDYDTITFTHVQTTNTVTPLGYAFYDENGKYLTGASNGGGTYNTAIKTIDVPEGAKYFAVMWMNTTHSRYDPDLYDISRFFCYGNIGASRPEITQPVQGIDLQKTQVRLLVNSEPFTISAVIKPSDATNQEVVWRIKSGAEIGTITPNGLECVFTPGSVAGTAVIEVKTVQGGFVAECTIAVAESEASVDLTPEFTWTPGSITYANGVASSQYAKDWFYSNRVDIGDYDTITFTHVQTTNTVTPLGYAFYDENGKYLTGASNGGGTYETAIKTIDVPEGAKYFAVMWMNTTHSRYDPDLYDISRFFCYGNYLIFAA